ncbi:hypothetical protein [Herbiconiux ginsengi]|uniref:Uncharacterized protein n=1 Tax=Herbiconiux ginsengi TaxID=381665 RepID=A0A1H3QPC7_9MICO|nr:hypothetical protein [Herbiconiux ginsengi]SDZ14931.1 hypothetical protein SAMN05216554_2643 [Herbiconiux ginsengi]
MGRTGEQQASANLTWLPVGAGGHVVVHTSRWWELYRARREHRAPCPLFHAALDVVAGERRHLVEMAPAWNVPAGERGVVATGAVGLRLLGRSRFFRYEVRCWADGILPDRRFAVGEVVRFPLRPSAAEALIERVADVPTPVWGRAAFGSDMWNSNSLISWLLQTSGIDAAAVVPPRGGRAPGWDAGIAAARLRA